MRSSATRARCGGEPGRWGREQHERSRARASHHPRGPPRRAADRCGAPPLAAGRIRGPGEGEGVAADRDRRGEAAARAAGPHAVLRAARSGQDDPRPPHGKGAGVNIRTTSGPVLERPGDLVGMLTSLGAGDILFIDEVHRLRPVLEEFLYPAMEDYRVDVRIADGPHAQTIPMALERFTLIGATTRFGLLTPPMRARFGLVERLAYYPPDD